MRLVRVLNGSRGNLLAAEVAEADRWWQRLRGLLGRPPLAPGTGLLLHPCPAVHTWGLSYPIDVAFLDRDLRVVALFPALPPRRHTRFVAGARFALELPAGTLDASGTRPGDSLVLEHPPLTP